MNYIILNPNFNSNENISSTASTLSYRNDYFVNFEIGRGDLTNQFTIIEFLNDPLNSIIVNAFYQFINNNYTPVQVGQIEGDNQKLSDSFNSYYNSAIAGLDLNIYFPSNSAETSVFTNYRNNIFYPNGNRDLSSKNGLSYTTTADSYYVNVVLFESESPIAETPYELDANINNGYQIEKEVVQLENAVLSGKVVTERVVTINYNPQELVNGFVTLNYQDSPFNDFSNDGLDYSIVSFEGKTVYQIDAEINGNIGVTEVINPQGTTDVLIGKNQTFTFQTNNPLKSIQQVLVDGVSVSYDRLNNLSKQVAGQYTFSSVTTDHKIAINFV